LFTVKYASEHIGDYRSSDTGEPILGNTPFCSFLAVCSNRVIIIFWALVRHETVISIIGGVESAFFWPVLNFAMRIRRTNIMIRLLEVPLERARTADEAAQMLFRVFEKNFQDVASPTIQQKGASEH
jgi:hypothetical protein